MILMNFVGVLLFDEPGNYYSSAATSEWTQTSNLDFNSGTLENISVTQSGEVLLASETRFIEDNFTDLSKIMSKKNLIFDNSMNEIKPIIIINQTFGGNSYDYSCSIRPTLDGGYIIAGYTASYGAGEGDIWLIKTDGAGNEQWRRTLGGAEDDTCRSIQQTKDGGYILVGHTESFGAGVWDIWLIKTNGSGDEQWNKTFGGSKYEFGKSVQQTLDGGYIIIGDTDSFGNGSADIWLIKTDSIGNEQWNKTIGGNRFDKCVEAQQTNDGGYIITGYTESYDAGEGDIWLIKTDNMGNEQWNKSFGGTNWDRGYSGHQTFDNGFIITGCTSSIGAGSTDVWLIKTDSMGIEQWNKTFGGINGDQSSSVCQTSDGGYILVGETGSYGNIGVDEYGYPYSDVWLIKTDSIGNEQWNRTFGGTENDQGSYVLQTLDGGYIITGGTSSYGIFERSDVWLIKTDRNGNIDPIGTMLSKNLMESSNSSLINYFNYTSNIPSNSNLKVRFSKDNLSWYNSLREFDKWNPLIDGFNSINLLSLNWNSSSFYYRVNFSFNINTNVIPVLQNINLSYIQYLTSGTIEIQPFNANNETIGWKNINWTVVAPKATMIKFQIRTAETEEKLNENNFIGPNGELHTFYNHSGQSIWSGHDNESWFQIKAYLSTINTLISPIIKDITISFNYKPRLEFLRVIPPVGNITTMFNFTVNYFDKNDDQPLFIRICIDGINYTMNESDPSNSKYSFGKKYWYATKFNAGNHTYCFFSSDGEFECFTDPLELSMAFGPLVDIKIEPSNVTLKVEEFQKFTAYGYDEHLNPLTISPHWSVSGGGSISQNGNFSANKLGIWYVNASVGNITGNATLKVIDYKTENGFDNDSVDINVTDNGNNKKNMSKKDSDLDGIPDYWEDKFGFNLNDPSDVELDPDSDNLTNLEEYLNHTDPTDPDTDNDSYNDGLEVDKGTDPLDDKDYPSEEDADKDKKSDKIDFSIYVAIIGIIIFILIMLTLYINLKKKREEG